MLHKFKTNIDKKSFIDIANTDLKCAQIINM